MSAITNQGKLFDGYKVVMLGDGSYLVENFANVELLVDGFRLELHQPKRKLVLKLNKEFGAQSKNYLASACGNYSRECREGTGSGTHRITKALRAESDYRTLYGGYDLFPILLQQLKQKFDKKTKK